MGIFEKIFGAEGEQNARIKTSVKHDRWLVIYGYGEEDGNGWNWRKRYDHEPDKAEVKSDIYELINSATDAAILTGCTWEDNPVYLSSENQMNFKTAHDLAVQAEGATLPVTLKLGEDSDGEPVYHTFESVEDIQSFWQAVVSHIQSCLEAGWATKDGIDWTEYGFDSDEG